MTPFKRLFVLLVITGLIVSGCGPALGTSPSQSTKTSSSTFIVSSSNVVSPRTFEMTQEPAQFAPTATPKPPMYWNAAPTPVINGLHLPPPLAGTVWTTNKVFVHRDMQAAALPLVMATTLVANGTLVFQGTETIWSLTASSAGDVVMTSMLITSLFIAGPTVLQGQATDPQIVNVGNGSRLWVSFREARVIQLQLSDADRYDLQRELEGQAQLANPDDFIRIVDAFWRTKPQTGVQTVPQAQDEAAILKAKADAALAADLYTIIKQLPLDAQHLSYGVQSKNMVLGGKWRVDGFPREVALIFGVQGWDGAGRPTGIGLFKALYDYTGSISHARAEYCTPYVLVPAPGYDSYYEHGMHDGWSGYLPCK